jgi:hypothetical protein
VKLYRFLSKPLPSYKPESGDILVFFSHVSKDIPEYVFWDGILTLHTNIPVKHYAVVIDDTYFVECRQPDFPKYDNITKDITYSIPRLAKLKYIHKDWGTGEIMVIKTGKKIDSEKRETILRNFNKKNYVHGGGCIGHFNSVYKIIDDTKPFFISVESILKHYKNAKLGYIRT